MIMHQLRADIEDFMGRTGMTRTALGRLALSDPHAILNWLADDTSDPRISTVERVYDFMNEFELTNKIRKRRAKSP